MLWFVESELGWSKFFFTIFTVSATWLLLFLKVVKSEM